MEVVCEAIFFLEHICIVGCMTPRFPPDFALRATVS